MFLNVLICTGILWVLQNLLILPLSAHFADKRLSSLNLPVYSSGDVSYEDLPISERSMVDRVFSRYYITIDVIVLGLIGFLAGLLLGFYFIGISFDKKGWPGMAAFIVLSIIGSGMFEPGYY